MLLSYRDPKFWEKFLTKTWNPRIPTVFRQPFKSFPFSEAMLLRALQTFAEGVRAGDTRKQCLVSIGGTEVAPRRPLRKLFEKSSQTLAELEARSEEAFQEKFGLMVTHMQATDPELWHGLTSFIQDAGAWIDPVPRAYLDLFYGNYGSTFTGLHKDTQEIVAFVVRGKKRMLAWPFEYFLSKAKGVIPADRHFNKRLPIDHSPYRKDAIVLDADAGDVIYWPSDYWHVSEPRSDDFSAMVSLGLFRPAALSKPTTQTVTHSEHTTQRIRAAKTQPDAAEQLRWITGYGFERGGPLSEPAGGARRQIPSSFTVVKSPSTLLVWKTGLPQNRVLVSSNGHSIKLPYSDSLLEILERLDRAEEVTVKKSTKHGASTTSFETNWNKRSKLETRKRTSKRHADLVLLDWLLRTYAVEPLPEGTPNYFRGKLGAPK